MIKNVSCRIIEDLLTLYVDGLTCKESNELIENHMSQCTGCNKYLESMKDGNIVLNCNYELDELAIIEKDNRLIKSIKYKLLNMKIISVILGALLALFLLQGERAFQSVLIYPLLGVASYGIVKRIWLPPFIVTIIYFLGSVIFLQEGMPILIIAFLCGVLTLAGTVIGYCIKRIWFLG